MHARDRAPQPERARRDTAPGPFKRLTPLTGEASNLAVTTVLSAAMVVGGVVLLAVSLS